MRKEEGEMEKARVGFSISILEVVQTKEMFYTAAETAVLSASPLLLSVACIYTTGDSW